MKAIYVDPHLIPLYLEHYDLIEIFEGCYIIEELEYSIVLPEHKVMPFPVVRDFQYIDGKWMEI